jgi:hypothetical protein
MKTNWPLKRDPTIDLCPGMLVQYRWAGSHRMALVLDRQPILRFIAGLGGGGPVEVDSVLVQWCAGDGVVPSMTGTQGESLSIEKRSRPNAQGWLQVRTARGFPMFARVKV